MEKRLTTALLTLIPSLAVGADWTADEIEARIKSCPARDANTYYILLSCVHGRYTSLPDSDQYKDRLGERTAQLQKLLEEGSILRKNDLEKFLARRADLVSHAAKTNESVAIQIPNCTQLKPTFFFSFSIFRSLITVECYFLFVFINIAYILFFSI